jgi:hypothetical protein
LFSIDPKSKAPESRGFFVDIEQYQRLARHEYLVTLANISNIKYLQAKKLEFRNFPTKPPSAVLRDGQI